MTLLSLLPAIPRPLSIAPLPVLRCACRVRRGGLWALIMLLPCLPLSAETTGPSAEGFDRLSDNFETGTINLKDDNEAQNLLNKMRRLLPPDDPVRSRRYKAMQCDIGFFNNKQAGLEFAERELSLARKEGLQSGLIRMLQCRGYYLEILEGPRVALADYSEAVERSRTQGENLLLAKSLTVRGQAHSFLGEQVSAMEDFIAAQTAYEAVGLQSLAEKQIFQLAAVYRRLGVYDKAEEYLKKSKSIAERDGDAANLLVTQLQFGFLYTDQGQYAKARAVFEQAMQTANTIADPSQRGGVCVGLASALNHEGQYAQALSFLQQAEQLFAKAHDVYFKGSLALEIGISYAGLGETAKALKSFNIAAAEWEEKGNHRYLVRLYEARRLVYERLGRDLDAIADARRYIETHVILDRNTLHQRSSYLSYQFDEARRNRENQRLLHEQISREQELSRLQSLRAWQSLAIGVTLLFALLLTYLAWRQIDRSRRMQILAMSDELTGLANRRSILLFGEDTFKATQLNNTAFSVLVLDIDHFKRINDSLGHGVGDSVLQSVAKALQNILRPNERVGRIGGEEFLVVLPGVDLADATQIAARIRGGVECLDLSPLDPDLHVTVSLGVAECERRDRTLAELCQRADAALYEAKNQGRNRVNLAASVVVLVL